MSRGVTVTIPADRRYRVTGRLIARLGDRRVEVQEESTGKRYRGPIVPDEPEQRR